MSEQKKTNLYEIHEKFGAKMVPFAGFWMPLKYSSIQEEHLAVRQAAGLFDVSHMGEFIISGVGAEDFLQSLLTNDVKKLKPMRCHYTTMCNEKGGIIDDLLLYRFEDYFMIVVNASNRKKNWKWLQKHSVENVSIVDKSDEISLIALQGPKSIEIAGRIYPELLSTKKNRIIEKQFNGAMLKIATTGYTGEYGIEIYCNNTVSAGIWNKIMETGKSYGIKPIGLGARDTLRMEMGYCLYGNDIDETTSPLNSGLRWVVKMKKGDFIGREIFVANEPKQTLVGLLSESKAIPRKGNSVFFDGNRIGEVTSGGFSPSLKQGIAIARIVLNQDEEGKRVNIEIRNKQVSAQIVHFQILKK
ncbi:glycine cleavage system aminomethyltransferase GcvT [bacterium]|nr:glycine cleavage system aminomethyltransferase GcvT [bacterium]